MRCIPHPVPMFKLGERGRNRGLSLITSAHLYRRRVVIPLALLSNLGSAFADTPLNPVFTVEGVKVVLHPLEIVSVACDQLGEKVASLASDGDLITSAMDELLTRAWA